MVCEKTAQENCGLYDFTNKIERALTDYYGENKTIRTSDVLKNNGVNLKCLSIIDKETNITPTIYLNAMYDRYLEGEQLGNIVMEIIDFYELHKCSFNFEVDDFSNYEKIKNRIVYKLVNKDKNKELMKDIPYVEYLDMIIVFYCLVELDDIGKGNILIRNEHLSIWNVTEEDIYNIARINTPYLLNSKVRNMNDVIRSIFHNKISERYDTELTDEMIDDMLDMLSNSKFDDNSIKMYVVSNSDDSYGAACILYKNLLKNLAKEVNSNLIILPSSIHEVIIIPDKEIEDYNHLKEMVYEVNRSELAEDEILSDSVYYYNAEEDQIDYLKY